MANGQNARMYYLVSMGLVHIIYLAVFFGIIVKIPDAINYLNIVIQVGLCLILMIRFNPFRSTVYVMQPGDTTFIFASSFLLFTNVVLKFPL